MSMGDVLLQGKHICKSYRQGKKSNQVLNDVDIEIYDGDFTVIMGSSGAGKSTLLYCLSGMDSISGGEVLYRGEETDGIPADKRVWFCVPADPPCQ